MSQETYTKLIDAHMRKKIFLPICSKLHRCIVLMGTFVNGGCFKGTVVVAAAAMASGVLL